MRGTIGRLPRLIAVLAIAASATGIARAGEPAVSDVNAKISGFGGTLKNDDGTDVLGGIAGSLTLPAGHAFGLQLDAAYARLQSDDFYDTGAHLFWRDPGVGLLGLYGGYAHSSALGGVQVTRIGIEAQVYWKTMTFEGALGQETGDVSTQAYGHAKLDFYLTPNWMVKAGYTTRAPVTRPGARSTSSRRARAPECRCSRTATTTPTTTTPSWAA